MSEKEKYITEAIGECYPDWRVDSIWDGVERNYYHTCTKCGDYEYRHNLHNRFQQADEANKFFMVWNWAKKQDWWDEFVYNNLPVDHSCVDYEKFSDILYEYLRKNTIS